MAGRILIIEDDSASRELVRYLLTAAGYATLEAEDGRTGLRLARDEKPDLIICDLQIPMLNGYQVVQALRAHPGWQPVPLIAVTAFSMAGDREAALAAGFDEHISKPISPETFAAQIATFLPQPLRTPSPRSE